MTRAGDIWTQRNRRGCAALRHPALRAEMASRTASRGGLSPCRCAALESRQHRGP
ncbi:hypothetical protein A33M_2891 [Rhodovulum sp. PH10]|nr:hypothetical protein A33M_2891 [Rhodovulum sp. PH10]